MKRSTNETVYFIVVHLLAAIGTLLMIFAEEDRLPWLACLFLILSSTAYFFRIPREVERDPSDSDNILDNDDYIY
jgi:hypothetical protein